VLSPRPTRRTRLIVGCLLCVCLPALVTAQPVWSLDLGFEHSSVVITDRPATWDTARVQLGRIEPGLNGWFVTVDRQQRASTTDGSVSLSGYRRVRDWTLAGGVAAGVDPSFLYKRLAEVDVSRRVVGTTVASVGYRVLSYASGNVHQFQPAVAWNHARGEVQGRLYVTRRAGPQSSSVTSAISTWIDVHRRVRLSAAAAYGDRIFDLGSLASTRAAAALVNIRGRVEVVERHFLELGLGVAHEAPAFDHRTISLTYRRTF
jgi:YaiO family outer membrane protein